MSYISPHFRIPMAPVADPAAIVTAPQARFTVLTSRLIRLEWSPDGRFEDRASQPFWFRRQPVPPIRTVQDAAHTEIITDHLHLRYRHDPAGFTPASLSIELLGRGVTWHYGDADPANLLGTYRTLDTAGGKVPLEQGLLSRSGWAIVDDSQSLVFNDEGWLERRGADKRSRDLYFFGYGHDYTAALRDYTRVAGPVPLVPRWALGNWWSRYWAYTQDELQALMEEFERHQVPLSVCIIDMDWHIVETGNASRGWTGYTWNRKLWPRPYEFIAWLHAKGLKTALNLHPADGVYPHEDAYPEMARAMGIDPQSGEPVPFDIADPKFTHYYFRILHHPMEAQGVDFWWMDWQQGKTSRTEGLDPLWWLNHLHFHDLGRDGTKRPFVFSRWGGLGNHRYPIGFSGDTLVTWEALAFQPYFTATASNVAYSWWSHDIGGHMGGIEDPELYTRWVQWGVFSPILRLHSTNNAYQDRRPWGHGDDVFRITRDALQLRHALIPYIYTMSWRNHRESLPLISPMYHLHPEREEAYSCPNQYAFGSELIAAPYTRPRDPDTRLSRQVVWLPGGDWFDFFTGQRYRGDGWYALYGRLDDMPVFARAGAIVPLGPRVGWGGTDNPQRFEVLVFPGGDNRFTLYEDEGDGLGYTQGKHCLTAFSQTWRGSSLEFRIEAPQGDTTLVPASRSYELVFRGVRRPAHVLLTVNGRDQSCSLAYDEATETLRLGDITLQATDSLALTLSVDSGTLIGGRDRTIETCEHMLRAFRLENWTKAMIGQALPKIVADPGLLAIYATELADAHLRALVEVIRGAGVEHITNAGPELVILWNNGQSADLTYQLSAHVRHRLFQGEKGVLPRFKAIAREGGHRNQVKVDYLGLVSVVIA